MPQRAGLTASFVIALGARPHDGATTEHLPYHCRHSQAAPLVDRLEDRLRDGNHPHAVLAVRQQATLAVQLALERMDLQCVGWAHREPLLGRALPVAHADHVLQTPTCN